MIRTLVDPQITELLSPERSVREHAQRDDRGKAADDEPFGVDQHPLLLDVGSLRRIRAHGYHPWKAGLKARRWRRLLHGATESVNAPRQDNSLSKQLDKK